MRYYLEPYDMHGNVSEWCLDWYGTYGTNAVTDPKGASLDPYSFNTRVLRGGDIYDYAERCRSAYRDDSQPGYSSYTLGFRISRNLSRK